MLNKPSFMHPLEFSSSTTGNESKTTLMPYTTEYVYVKIDDRFTKKQDPQTFYKHINIDADELNYLASGIIPINYAKGFKTIVDFVTYVESSSMNRVSTSKMIEVMHRLSGEYEPMVSVGKIYKNKHNKPVVDLTDTLNIIENLGFIRFWRHENHIEYIKFNAVNLPVECFHVRSKVVSKTQPVIDGTVKHETFDKIKEAFYSNLIDAVNSVDLDQLDGYAEYTPGNISGKFSKMHLTEEMDYALPEFYPWVKMELHDYFQEYLNSRSNVLVLIGPPGTGKSTLIRTMIRDLNIRTMLAYKPDVINSEHFIKTCQNYLAADAYSYRASDDETNGGVNKFNYRAIVVEDADIIMSKRSDGNHRMSEILNATSGIATDNKSKFILSTNLKDIDNIDPALLRPGRCFDVLCFRDLSAEESRIIRKVRGLKERSFDNSRRYKLAEVLTDSTTQHQVEPIVKPRFGFV